MRNRTQLTALILLCAGLISLSTCSRTSQVSQSPSSQSKSSTTTADLKTVAPSEQATWSIVEDTTFKWNGRGAVRLIAEIQKPYSDPGDFTRVRIAVPGEKEFALENQDGWINYGGSESPLRWSRSTQDIADKAFSRFGSKYFMVVDVDQNRQALLLLSYGYASDSARLHVIELPSRGVPVVVFNDLLDIDAIQDFDGDGLVEIAGSPTLSQSLGDNLQTYDPAHVMHFGKVIGEHLTLSIPLSKAYNEKHLFGWAGPDSSESLLVFRPRTGKPRILPEEVARRLADQQRSK